MSLSANEQGRTYEEGKARSEPETEPGRQYKGTTDASSTSLKPNVAGLLCYIGVWITGIVFLIIEQKNSYVRFHAAQSIVVFGFLSLLNAVLHHIPVTGWFFDVAISIVSLILWIVLMTKAYQGELYRIPLASEVADRLLGVTQPASANSDVQAPQRTADSDASLIKTGNQANTMNTAGIISSTFAIVWNFVWLIFLNFYNDYIAYYHLENIEGVSKWVREPFLTSEFAA